MLKIKKFLPVSFVLALLLLTACTAPSPATNPADDTVTINNYVDGQGKTGISGQITAIDSGQPIAGAYVNIYPDASANLLGPSAYLSTPTDADGKYHLDVKPGTYYVVSRKRGSGESTGALSPGDLYSEHQRVITRVVDGKISIINLALAPMKAPMFFKRTAAENRTDTGIRGTLVDPDGKPVPGSFALAYSDPDIKRIPDFASTLSDGEGRFVIYLPQGGTYFLGARVNAWDMPRPGELYGKYGDPDPRPVAVADGTFTEGITITLTPFTGTYKKGKNLRPY